MLRDTAIFSFSRYVLLGMSFVRNFVVARILDPEEYGYWVIVMLVLTYGDQIHFGLRHAGDKEIPFLQGQGREDDSRKAANTIFGGILLISVIALAMLGVFAWIRGSERGAVENMILIAGVIVFGDQVCRYYLMIMRVKRMFVFSSRFEIIAEAVRMVLVCVLVYYFSLWGAITGFLAGAVFMALYAIFHFKREFVPRLDRRLLVRLLSLGVSLFGVSMLFVLLINADRLFAATILSKEQLGIYGVAALAAQLPLSFSQAVSMVVYPHMSETFGKSNTVEALYPLFAVVLRSLSFVIPLIAATTFFGATLLIGMFLPAYHESPGILVVLVPGVFFLSFIPFLSGLFTAANRARQFVLVELIAAMCAALLFYAVQGFLAGPKGVAVAMTTGMLVYAAAAIVAAYRLFAVKPVESLRHIAWTYFPSLYSMLVLGIIVNTVGDPMDPAAAMTGYGLFLLASVPLMVFAYHALDVRKIIGILRAPNG